MTLWCAYGCSRAIVYDKADADKMPATWICPVCEQRERDLWTEQQQQQQHSQPTQEHTAHEGH